MAVSAVLAVGVAASAYEGKRSGDRADAALAEQSAFNNSQLSQQNEQLALQERQLGQQAEAFATQSQYYADQLGLAQQQFNAQEEALSRQLAAAEKQAKENEESLNRRLQKKANARGALAGARDQEGSGVAGTLLTGTKGVKSEDLSLGKSTLLGS